MHLHHFTVIKYVNDLGVIRWNLSEMEEHWRSALEQRKKVMSKLPIEER
jgi:hypothetical protein